MSGLEVMVMYPTLRAFLHMLVCSVLCSSLVMFVDICEESTALGEKFRLPTYGIPAEVFTIVKAGHQRAPPASKPPDH